MHQRPASRRTDVHRRIEVQESSRPHSPPPSRRAEGRRPAPSPNCQGLTARRFSCAGRLGELTRFFRWLDQRHVTALAHVDTHTCEAYLAFRRYILDDNGTVVGEQGPSVRRAAAQIVVDLVNYRDLLTADRVRPDVRPWGGASASAVAEMRSGRDGNTTPADNDEILQPKLAAALHLVQVLGPHAITLNEQIREYDRVDAARATRPHPTTPPVEDILTVLADYTLPQHEDHGPPTAQHVHGARRCTAPRPSPWSGSSGPPRSSCSPHRPGCAAVS